MRAFPVLCVTLVLTLAAGGAGAAEFHFRYQKGDAYTLTSTVREEISKNGKLEHRSEITNTAEVKVTGANGEKAQHTLEGISIERTSRGNGERLVEWAEEYKTGFTKDRFGRYSIAASHFMPVVRNIPVFPAGNIEAGDTWEAEAVEAQDFRRSFNVSAPILLPFTVTYTYRGTEKSADGRSLDIITARYTYFFDTVKLPAAGTHRGKEEVPATCAGESRQTIFWDRARGVLHHSEEEFRIKINTTTGNTYDLAGVTTVHVSNFYRPEEAMRAAIAARLAAGGMDNVSLADSEQGLTLSVENINFEPDSATLDAAARATMEKIAVFLRSYPDRNLFVSGHTALAGTEAGRRALSAQRAKAVADYFVSIGVRTADQVSFEGFGATRPLAPNTTAEGMAKNRRVELTLMDTIDELVEDGYTPNDGGTL